ncbi:MAG: hypothetical protein L6R39_000506 [Caloplaca ligustica]|nr:MAG: hypothetical protein L6R39_000506 [Caloplaca ligustica]
MALINWDEVETYEWKNHGSESLKGTFGRLSSQVISKAVEDIADTQPFLDYSSFLSYVSAFSIDTVANDDILRLERLGYGATRTTFKGKCSTRWGGTEIAIKRLNLEIPRTKSTFSANSHQLRQQMAETSLELRVLFNDLLRFHPNIVDLLAISWEELKDDPDDDPLSIRPLLLTELACQQHPTLEDYFTYASSNNEMISADSKVSLLCDVASGLSAVHTCGVVHGDIKPQNILIFQQQPEGPLIAKISDFGGCFVTEELERTDPEIGALTYNLAGTEYWNAPEAASRDDPDFGRETRDYYGLGLVAWYILFEEPPLGDESDSSETNRRRIADIKADPTRMEQLLKVKFEAHWRLAGRTKESMMELSSVTGFYERQEKLQTLIDTRQVFEAFNDGRSWTVRRADEDRQYCFLFVIAQFLRRDPSTRRQDNLMDDMRVFMNDTGIARSLKHVFLMQAWQTFWSSYEAKDFSIWHIATLFREGQKTVKDPLLSAPTRTASLAWRTPTKNLSSEYSNNFDMEGFEHLPVALKSTFLRELHRRLNLENGPSRINVLLGLAYCETLGYKGEERVNKLVHLIEAARLGSNVAKRGVLALLKIEEITVDIDPAEHLRWLYDILFSQMPGQEQFIEMMMKLKGEPQAHIRVLSRVFERECLQSKTVRKRALPTDYETDWAREAFESSRDGDLFRLKLVLEKDPGRVNDTSSHGFNLLHVAVEYGHPEVVQLLRNHYGMSIETPARDDILPTVIALRAHDLDTLAALLAQGADHESVLGAHTLRCIANYGGPRALRQISYFISLWTEVRTERADFPRKAYLDGQFSVREEKVPDDEPDFPPIFATILGDNLGTLWSLLEMGCSTGPITEFSSSSLAPIHVAANLRPLHLALLLHHGADPNLRTGDEDMLTALQVACVAHSIPRYLFPRVQLTSVLQQEGRQDKALGIQPEDYMDARIFTARILCKYGADVNAQDWVGRTALAHCMANQDALPIAMMLVDEYRADIQIKDFRGLSCLHRAVLHHADTTMIDFCLDRGVLVDDTDINNLTPLMMAVTANKTLDAVEALVSHGADLLATQSKGWTALDLAIKEEFEEAVKYLFHEVVKKGALMPVMANQKDLFHQTMLHRLVYRGESFFEKYITYFPIESVQGTVQQHDIVGWTLLHHAVLARNNLAIEWFLGHQAHINVEGWRKLRPLHLACGMDAEDIITLLKDAGANIWATDAKDRTPSDYTELATKDGTFWPALVEQCVRDGEMLAKLPQKQNLDKVERENRERARTRGGW